VHERFKIVCGKDFWIRAKDLDALVPKFVKTVLLTFHLMMSQLMSIRGESMGTRNMRTYRRIVKWIGCRNPLVCMGIILCMIMFQTNILRKHFNMMILLIFTSV
jgi:hypothetical protein